MTCAADARGDARGQRAAAVHVGPDALTRMLPLWARVGDPGTHSVCVPVAGSQGRENTSPPLETQAHIQCVCQCGSARLLRQREYESAMGSRSPCGAPSKGRPRGGPCTGKPQ